MHKEKQNIDKLSKIKVLYKAYPLIFIGTCCLVIVILLICGAGIYHHHEHNVQLNHLQRIERVSDRTERRIARTRNKR